MEFDLKKIRETYKLNQQEFADELGITREMVGQMERGQKGVSKATKILITDFLKRNKVPSVGEEKSVNTDTTNVEDIEDNQRNQLINEMLNSESFSDKEKLMFMLKSYRLLEGEYHLLKKMYKSLSGKKDFQKGHEQIV